MEGHNKMMGGVCLSVRLSVCHVLRLNPSHGYPVNLFRGLMVNDVTVNLVNEWIRTELSYTLTNYWWLDQAHSLEGALGEPPLQTAFLSPNKFILQISVDFICD